MNGNVGRQAHDSSGTATWHSRRNAEESPYRVPGTQKQCSPSQGCRAGQQRTHRPPASRHLPIRAAVHLRLTECCQRRSSWCWKQVRHGPPASWLPALLRRGSSITCAAVCETALPAAAAPTADQPGLPLPACHPPTRPCAAALGNVMYMGSLWLSQRLWPLSSRYRAMPARARLEWDGRLPSTLHALAITVAGTYLFLLSPTFAEDHVRAWPAAAQLLCAFLRSK